MVIAAFAGTGKSYFAENVAEAKDFPVMPYKYINLEKDDPSKEEAEKSKADPSYDLNPEWPDNYIRAVSNQCHDYRYFIIPSDKSVLRGLQLLQIPYVLVYPGQEAKEEYRNRFVNRGNSEDFLNIFIDGWDRWMQILRYDSYGWCMELSSGKYLTDVKNDIDRIIDREETCVQLRIEVEDEELFRNVKETLKENGLTLAEYLRRYFEWIVHHAGEAGKILRKWEKESGNYGFKVIIEDEK